MLAVRSLSNSNLRYLFESREQPVSAEELLHSNHIGTSGKLEATLNLCSTNPPIEQKEYDAFKKIINDCASPELKAAYGNSYNSMMRFLAQLEVTGEKYRIHSIKTHE